MSHNLDLFDQSAEDPTLLPIGLDRMSPENRQASARRWVEALHQRQARIDAECRSRFMGYGWTCRWFATHKPANAEQELTARTISRALEILDAWAACPDNQMAKKFQQGVNADPVAAMMRQPNDKHATRIVWYTDADVGLKQFNMDAAHGVLFKQQPYDRTVCVKIVGYPGGYHFDTRDGIGFEGNEKSFMWHLIYKDIPSFAQVYGDVAGWPLINSAANPHYQVWKSEGWLGPCETRPREHRSWQDVPTRDQMALINAYSAPAHKSLVGNSFPEVREQNSITSIL